MNSSELFISSTLTAEQRQILKPTALNLINRARIMHQVNQLMDEVITPEGWEELRYSMTPMMEKMFRYGLTATVLENTLKAGQELGQQVGRRGRLTDVTALLVATEIDINKVLYGQAYGALLTYNSRLD